MRIHSSYNKIGYVFISNSSKPSIEQYESVEPYTIGNFGLGPLYAAKNCGFKLYYGINRKFPDQIECTNFDLTFYNQNSYRNIFAIRDVLLAFRNLHNLLKTNPNIKVIHCNTPIGGVVGRLCGRFHNVPTIIYTAHGFHFYKGASLLNRTVFKCIEYILARFTDALITMNQEDYEAASKFKLRKGGKVYYIPGVGVDTVKFKNTTIDVVQKKISLGLPKDSIVAIAMGDVIPRKNYKTAIEAVAKCNNEKLHYIICGRGTEIDELKHYSKILGIEKQVHFLGFRQDILELTAMSDFFMFASYQEGLPRSTMEAMSAGKPCIVSNIRGHVDLIDNYKGGILFNVNDSTALANAINYLLGHPEYLKIWGMYNTEKIKAFDIEAVKSKMLNIYNEIFDYNAQIIH